MTVTPYIWITYEMYHGKGYYTRRADEKPPLHFTGKREATIEEIGKELSTPGQGREA